jgi:hypothetical protein
VQEQVDADEQAKNPKTRLGPPTQDERAEEQIDHPVEEDPGPAGEKHAGIAEKIANDLDIMAALAELLQKHLDAARAYQPVALVREFRRLLLNELDFSSERRNLE